MSTKQVADPGTDKGEECARCGKVDCDLRTLWMACFYAMEELDIPFEQQAIHGQTLNYRGKKELPRQGITVSAFSEPAPASDAASADNARTRKFYTLRVCKRCRSEWLAAIQQWYAEGAKYRDKNCAQACVSTGTGVYIRKFGHTVEATPVEVEKLRARMEEGFEPVTVASDLGNTEDL